MFIKIICAFVILNITLTECFFNLKLRNSCPTFTDYYTMWFNKNCYYEPDVGSKTTEILKRHVGYYETYEVETEDGFYLTLFRLPKKNPKGIIVFFHPVITDSVVYVGQSNSSIAFVMLRAGYEVWLTNNRGTYYSMKHKYLKPSSYEYWNFSFEEIALYDIPVNLKFIKEKTKRDDLIYIGHSMATTAGTIYTSLKPKEALKAAKVYIYLSPSVYHKYTSSALIFVSPLLPPIMPLAKLLHIYSIGTPYNIVTILFHLLGLLNFKEPIILADQINAGFSGNEFDLNYCNLLTSVNPRGSSLKTINHYAQQITSRGPFRRYDYGKEENMKLYNSSVPPEYPVENIIAPTYLMASKEDALATVADSKTLYNKMSKQAKIYGNYFFEGFNHIDFHYGKHRQEKLFQPILDLLDKILNS